MKRGVRFIWFNLSLLGAGALLGYLSQVNWGVDVREAVPAWRLLAGGLGGALVYPPLIWGLAWLAARTLGQSPGWALERLAPLMVLAGAAMLFPNPDLVGNGVLVLALILAMASALAVMLISPTLGGAFILILALLALGTTAYHDRHTRYYERGSVEKVLKGDADAANRYRIMVPYAAGRLAKHLDLTPGCVAFFLRSFLTFVVFVVSVRVCAGFVPGALSRAPPFLHAALLPFSYMFKYSTDEAEILGAWLLLWVTHTRRLWWAVAVVIGFSLNRETMILLAPWFWLYGMRVEGWGLSNRTWLAATAMVLGWILLEAGLVVWLGFAHQPGDRIIMQENLDLVERWLAYLGPERKQFFHYKTLAVPFSFVSGLWLACLVYSRRLPQILRWGVLVNFPLLLGLQFVTGRLLESRQLYLLLPFVVSSILVLLGRDPQPAADTD